MRELSILRPENKLGRFNRPWLLLTTPKTSGGRGRLGKMLLRNSFSRVVKGGACPDKELLAIPQAKPRGLPRAGH